MEKKNIRLAGITFDTVTLTDINTYIEDRWQSVKDNYPSREDFEDYEGLVPTAEPELTPVIRLTRGNESYYIEYYVDDEDYSRYDEDGRYVPYVPTDYFYFSTVYSINGDTKVEHILADAAYEVLESIGQ